MTYIEFYWIINLRYLSVKLTSKGFYVVDV